MKQARTKGRRWAKQYQKRSLGNERVKAARLEANRKNHEEMKNKLLNQHKERAKCVAKYGVLKNGDDVENVMKTFKSNAAKKTKALKTYILVCFVKDLHHQQLADTVDKSLWVFSQKGKQLSVEQLSINLGQLLLKMQEFQLSMMVPLVLEFERCAEDSENVLSDSDSSDNESDTLDGLHEYLFVEKDIVVVAFEDDWYVGEVVKLISETVGSINYMHHSATNHSELIWPSRKEVSDVDSTFVTKLGLSDCLIPIASGRKYTHENEKYICRL